MPTHERFEAVLPADLARFVHSQVGQGALASEEDVLRVAVEALRDRRDLEAEREAFQVETRRKIADGAASLRAGLGMDGDAFMAALDADLALT